jgi:hypothetical protein
MDTLVTLEVVDSPEGIELEELDAEVGEVITAELLDVMLTTVVGAELVVGPELVVGAELVVGPELEDVAVKA